MMQVGRLLIAPKEELLMYFIKGEMPQFRCSVIIFSCCAALLCSAYAVSAQETRFPRPAPNVSHTHAATGSSPVALDGSATARKYPASTKGQRTEKVPPPSSQPTQPATVTFKDGKLTVAANNSSLTEILQNLANISGMTINGLDKGPRIFGVYGPGNSRDVLKDLLVGSGYNFIMVGGGSESTPRELILTAQNGDAPAIVPVHPATATAADRDEAKQPEPETNPSVPEALGPGAVAPVPSLDEQDDNTRAQSTLQRLQHIQDQQQPQNAPQ